MSGLLKKWFAEFTKSQKRRPASRPNQRVRLGLESLETRMVPTLMVGGFTHVAPAREVLSLADSQPAAQVRIVAPVQVHRIAPVSHSVSHPAASEIILHPPTATGPGRGHVAINTGVRPSNTAISDNTNGSGCG